MWYRIKEDKIYLSLSVRPNAKQNAIVDVHGDALRLTIKAKPEAGKANSALIAFLSETFNIPKSEITLIQGEHGRKKQVKLPWNNAVKAFLKIQEASCKKD